MHGAGWGIPEDKRKYDFHKTTRSLAEMTDAVENGHAEWWHCEKASHDCRDRDRTGEPMSFPRGRMNLQPDQIVALRFPLAGIRTSQHLENAYLAFEFYGETELFPRPKPTQSAPLTVDIQVELSPHALALQDELRDITSRELSNSSVTWEVPPQQQHVVVKTPNLMPVLTLLKSMPDWTSESSVNIMLTPTSGTGMRIFKVRDKRTGSNLHVSRDIMRLMCAVICLLIMCFMARHGQDDPAERIVKAIMALEGAKCGCPVDHQAHSDCKPEKLKATKAKLEKTGIGDDAIRNFLVGELTGDKSEESHHNWRAVKNKMRSTSSFRSAMLTQRTESTDDPTDGESVNPLAAYAGAWWVSDSGHHHQTLRKVLEHCDVDGAQGLRRRAETVLPDSAVIRDSKAELIHDILDCFKTDDWSEDRKSQALFFSALAHGTLLPPPGSGRPWGWRRWQPWAILLAFSIAVLNAVVRALKFGSEAIVEYELNEPMAATIDATLAVAEAYQGQLMVLWIAMFAVTCNIASTSILYAVGTLKDKLHDVEEDDVDGIAIWRQSVLDTLYRVHKVSDMLNNDWENIQVQILVVFCYLLYKDFVDIALQDKEYRDLGDYLGMVVASVAILAVLLPVARVTNATDEVKVELARLNESYQHAHPTLSREVAQLITHVNCKQMGYHLFETIKINTGTLKTLLTYAVTLVIAVVKVREL